MSQRAYSIEIFDGVTVDNEIVSSAAIDVNAYIPLGNFASQLHVSVDSGSTSVDIDLWVSINGDDYVFSRNLFEAATEASGPSADGKQVENMGMEVCKKFMIKATEDGTGPATVSMWIGVQ